MAENVAAIVYSRTIIRFACIHFIFKLHFISHYVLVVLLMSDPVKIVQEGGGGEREARKAGEVEEPES